MFDNSTLRCLRREPRNNDKEQTRKRRQPAVVYFFSPRFLLRLYRLLGRSYFFLAKHNTSQNGQLTTLIIELFVFLPESRVITPVSVRSRVFRMVTTGGRCVVSRFG